MWIDTRCIDKRGSTELSEAINSMYRWYRNSQVCYAYFHDWRNLPCRNKWDNLRCSTSNGWPEWFSCGWTLQEVIAYLSAFLRRPGTRQYRPPSKRDPHKSSPLRQVVVWAILARGNGSIVPAHQRVTGHRGIDSLESRMYGAT